MKRSAMTIGILLLTYCTTLLGIAGFAWFADQSLRHTCRPACTLAISLRWNGETVPILGDNRFPLALNHFFLSTAREERLKSEEAERTLRQAQLESMRTCWRRDTPGKAVALEAAWNARWENREYLRSSQVYEMHRCWCTSGLFPYCAGRGGGHSENAESKPGDFVLGLKWVRQPREDLTPEDPQGIAHAITPLR